MKKPTPSKEREKFFEIANDCAFEYWRMADLIRDRENASKAESAFIQMIHAKYKLEYPASSNTILGLLKTKIADAFIGEGK